MIEIQAEDKIYSSGTFNMSGQEIEQDKNTIKPNGRLMFGSNFILENGNKFQYVIQMTPDNTIKKIDLNAQSQRSARMELNKMYPQLKHAYSKPSFVTVEYLNKKIVERNEAILKDTLV